MEKTSVFLIRATVIIVLGSVALFGGKAHAQANCPSQVKEYFEANLNSNDAEKVVINAWKINNIVPSSGQAQCRQALEVAFVQNFGRAINEPKPKAWYEQPDPFGLEAANRNANQYNAPRNRTVQTNCQRNGQFVNCTNY